MRIHQLNLGNPEPIEDYHGETFISAIRKRPSDKQVWLAKDGLKGDSSYEDCHGTPNMALHIYSFEHYRFFNERAGREIPVPAFGENLTVLGMQESQVYIGDIFKIGDAIIQISQPTERCRTIGRSIGEAKMLKWIHEHMMTGYYARVLQEGHIERTSAISLVERGDENLSVDYLNQILFKQKDRNALADACKNPDLSFEWKERAETIYQKAGY